MRYLIKTSAALAVVIALGACAGRGPTASEGGPGGPGAGTPPAAGSREAATPGPIVGTPRPGSKFARLKIGMPMEEVQNVMDRAPDRSHTYESGKRWIPFYFGSDARRMQALYKGEGCLIFTSGNAWGGGGGELLGIEHDATGRCYQP